MVQSIIEGLRNYFAEFPMLAEIQEKDHHIDSTDADIDGNYGIFPDGSEPVGKPYIDGSREMRYSAKINIRRFSDTDGKRLLANAWLEKFRRLLANRTARGLFPEMPEYCVPTELEAVSAGLADTDTAGKRNVYTVKIILTYIEWAAK